MIGYLARRVVQAALVVFGVTLLVFLLEHVIPGGAARAALGPRATEVQIEQFNKLNGYDLPIWQQFYDYCRGLDPALQPRLLLQEEPGASRR